MENEEGKNVGEVQETTPETNVENTSVENTGAENIPVTPNATQSFTQEQVNDIVRERLERSKKGIYDKLGVTDDAGLDVLIEKLKGYDTIKSQLDTLNADNSSLKEKIMFYENNVLANREDDVRTYFKGKGIAMTTDALKSALETHPEWLKSVDTPKPTNETTIVPIGSEKSAQPKENEEDVTAKLFGLDHFVN